MASTTLPVLQVEIAFGTNPLDPSPAWQDVSGLVLASQGLQVTRGSTDEKSNVTPSKMTLTLDNSDGRFTAGRAASAYYPNVVFGKRIRYSLKWPAIGSSNYINNSSFEVDLSGWQNTAPGLTACTSVRSSGAAFVGTYSSLVTWPTTSAGSLFGYQVSGLVIGRTYVFSAYVNVVAGSPQVNAYISGVGAGLPSVAYTGFQRVYMSWVATANTHLVGIYVANSTAGDQVYVDATQVDDGATPTTYTNLAPVVYRRFDGFIDSWPTEWAANANLAHAQISATDGWRWLNRADQLGSIVEQETLAQGPVAYYPLGDATGSIQAGAVGNSQPLLATSQVGTGGSATFGAQGILALKNGGLPTDNFTSCPIPSVSFLPSTAVNGKYLTATLTTGSSSLIAQSGQVWALTGTIAAQTITSWENNATNRITLSEVVTTGVAKLDVVIAGTIVATISTAGSIADSTPKHFIWTLSQSAGTVTVNLYMNGALVGSTTYAGALPAIGIFNIGGSATLNCYQGSIAHVALWDGTALASTVVTQLYNAGLNGFATESSNLRTARLAGYAGIVNTALEAGSATSCSPAQTYGNNAATMIHDVEALERGKVFFRGDGALVFQARSHRTGATSKFTLTPDQFTGAIPKTDDFGVVNDITMSRPNGVTVRRTSTASIAINGRYRQNIILPTSLDADVASHGDYTITKYATPKIRYSSILVDLFTQCASNPTFVTALLAAELSDLFTLASMPSQAPSATTTLFIEGITETFRQSRSGSELSLAITASPGS
jgi:hypothetical protein